VGLRDGRRDEGCPHGQHALLVGRPLRRSAPRARRLLVQPEDRRGRAGAPRMVPTVLDLFGVPVPAYMQGRRLFGWRPGAPRPGVDRGDGIELPPARPPVHEVRA
jgi:hypothetical protein